MNEYSLAKVQFFISCASPQIISVLPRPFMLFYSFRLLDANSSYSRSSASTCKTEHSFCLNYPYKFTSTFCRVLAKIASFKKGAGEYPHGADGS